MDKDVKEAGFEHKGNVLIVDTPENMPQELKDFVQDIKKITKTCPFCGQPPHKDVIELGVSAESINKIKNEDEYKMDRDYRKIMNDYIKENMYHAEFRISCVTQDCLNPTTGFKNSEQEAEEKWNTRK